MYLRLLGVLRDEGESQSSLVRKVVVEGTDGGPGLLGDSGHGDSVVADSTEELFGGLEEAGTTDFGPVLLRTTSRHCRS